MARRHVILVVDDEMDVVQSVQDLLRRQYRVLGATRAQEGLDILRRQEVHVVMSDQRMPGMTGVEFLHQVSLDFPDIVRLLFTGYADLRAMSDAINQGSVYRYLAKPWESVELEAVIRQAADQSDLLAERRHLLAELQQKNTALEKANESLRKANALKEAFISVASHELRTPVTIVQGLSELAASTSGMTEPLLGWLQHIHRASTRLNQLTNQLTQMLKKGHYERLLERQPVDMATLVREAVDEVRPFIERRGQELVLEVASDLASLNLDVAKVRDAVAHLVLNAVKFTSDGGRIRVAAERTADGSVEVRVTDSGVGIDPAHLPHLFEPFFTSFDVSRHSSGQYEFGKRGLGLGLALVKAFVELHGGTVGVTSTPGTGSTFLVRLPS